MEQLLLNEKAVHMLDRLSDLGICGLVLVLSLIIFYFSLRDLRSEIAQLRLAVDSFQRSVAVIFRAPDNKE